MWHPQLKLINVEMVDGCPEVSKKVAAQLIKEVEGHCREGGGSPRIENFVLEQVTEVEQEWIARCVEKHPVFEGVPEEIKERVMMRPGQLQKEQRKVTVHLYAGPDEGYTLKRAYKEIGGDVRDIIEVNLKRGEEQDMVEGDLFAGLLTLAMDGNIGMVLGRIGKRGS